MHVVDTTMFFAPQSGGVKRYLLAKHAWLTRHSRCRHTIVVPGAADSDDHSGIVTLASPRIPFANGYRLPVCPACWQSRLTALAPDVIEAGDPYRLAWQALAVGQELGVPVAGFYHSDLVRLVTARLGRWPERWIGRYVRHLYRNFDLVWAPSQVMRERLEALGVERVALQPLGVDTKLFHPRYRDSSLRRELELPERTRLLVFAGRFAREKNIGVLLDAFAQLGHNYHLLLVGGKRCRRPQPNVTVYPYQSGGMDLVRTVASCDAFVHAGDQETFGLVVLEAMACGLPVVGVAGGAVAELVDEQTGILASPGSVGSMTDAIAALYEHDIAKLGKNARSRVEAEYGWNQVLPNQLARYARLAAVTTPCLTVESHAVG